jgi:holo-[acyl-carrier protein] synthase
MIVGTGIDLVEISRIVSAVEKHGDRFLKRLFSPEELDYCLGKAAQNQHLAGRFAAKEAVFKALGTGWAEGVSWLGVEILPGKAGAPQIKLSGPAKERLRSIGGQRIHISISHTDKMATAVAIVEGGE